MNITSTGGQRTRVVGENSVRGGGAGGVAGREGLTGRQLVVSGRKVAPWRRRGARPPTACQVRSLDGGRMGWGMEDWFDAIRRELGRDRCGSEPRGDLTREVYDRVV